VKLDAVVSEVTQALRFDTEDKKIELSLVEEGLTVEADEQLLRQVVFNLLLNAIQAVSVGGRIQVVTRQTGAADAFAHAVTLVKDDRHQVPLTAGRETPILYLSVLDYPGGWQIAAPSRTFIPELKKRWPQVTSMELSDRTTLADLMKGERMTNPRIADILADVARAGRGPQGRILVGFAAETGQVAEHARAKLESKHADLIVANDVTAEGAGFDHDTNVITLYARDGSEQAFPRMPKIDAAQRILDRLLALRNSAPQISVSRQAR